MKKLIPLLILLLILPVVAQKNIDNPVEPNDDAAKSTTAYVYESKGLVLKVEPNRINFEEMWFPITQQKAGQVKPLVVVNELGREIPYETLVAPFMARIAYTNENDTKILLRIQVLEQFHYDDDGFIRK